MTVEKYLSHPKSCRAYSRSVETIQSATVTQFQTQYFPGIHFHQTTMPYQGEDKENSFSSPLKHRRYDAAEGNNSKSSFSQHGAEAKETKKGAFSRLLKDVTNTLRNDLDEKTAIRVQDDDATSIIKEWISEQRGKEYTPCIERNRHNIYYFLQKMNQHC